MSNRNHFLYFDPGAAATGWAYACVDRRAFSRPENKVLRHIVGWRSGEFTGTQTAHLTAAVNMIQRMVDKTSFILVEIGTEDFDLVQTVGGKEALLSPVRINAILDWECYKRGLKLRYQNRSLRINQTKDRLKLFGFDKRFKKDELAAMQHLVYRLRKIKDASKSQPWKLNSGDVLNDHYDCRCQTEWSQMRARRPKCDLVHPR